VALHPSHSIKSTLKVAMGPPSCIPKANREKASVLRVLGIKSVSSPKDNGDEIALNMAPTNLRKSNCS